MHLHRVLPRHGFPARAAGDGCGVMSHRATLVSQKVLLQGEGDEPSLPLRTFVAAV